MLAHNEEMLGKTVPSFRLLPPLKWGSKVYMLLSVSNIFLGFTAFVDNIVKPLFIKGLVSGRTASYSQQITLGIILT